MTTQLTLFDYAALDTETRIIVQQRIARLHDKDRKFNSLMRQTIETAWEMGEELYGLQQDLDHGMFLPCIQSEFPHWSQRSAYNFINVYKNFKFATVANLEMGLRAAYLLAAPSTPESAREEALIRAEEGEPITHELARGIIHDHKHPAEPYEPGLIDRYSDYPTAGEAARAMYQDGAVKRPYLPDVLQYIEMMPGAIPAIEKKISEIKPADHQLINQSTNNEWYTPRPFLDAAHEVMGGVDLDPASNALANQAVRAEAYYTIEEDGYAQPWEGRLWLNPPYGTEDGESNQARWSRRLVAEYRAGNVAEAILLVNAVPGNSWFAPLKDFPICFPDGRIRFYNADTEAGQPTHSNALVYLGPNVATFVRVFSRFGAVMARLVEYDGHVFIHGIEVDDGNSVPE